MQRRALFEHANKVQEESKGKDRADNGKAPYNLTEGLFQRAKSRVRLKHKMLLCKNLLFVHLDFFVCKQRKMKSKMVMFRCNNL